MRRSAPRAAVDAGSAEQRTLPRKNVLLSGILFHIAGKETSECIIREINARGAAISLSKPLPIGARTVLLDTGNRTAHFARVVRSTAGRTGLFFVRSYPMNLGLPTRLAFLWRFLLEENLRQAERAIAAGAKAELALASIGVTREHIHQLARYARTDRRLRQLLDSARRLLDE